ncbi:MAG: hypothetical protein QHH18_07450 [Candidatus Bathyarchaeota archaeon]|jgi:hypothetical protein|nr:hypothetical protein [Candidatus Bathyarchaeota archaeon A05DMB-5]MDH7558417.1 hypothetical protein [Candidatus Bathyarchaeota archaeon]
MHKTATLTTIFLIFALAQTSFQTQITNTGTIISDTPTIIFENGFEEGNFSAWTHVQVFQGQSFTCVTATNQTTPPHHGNYQAIAIINGSLLSTSAYAYKDLPTTQATISLRFYVYLSTYYAPWQPHETYLGTIASNENILCQIGLTETNAELVFIAYHSGYTVIIYSNQNLTTNTWHCIEIQRTQHPTNGEYHTWLDGTELTEFRLTNIDTSSHTANRIYIANYHGCAYHPPNQVTFYTDCIKVANTYIGPE